MLTSAMPPVGSLPKVMYVRLKEEGVTPSALRVKDSAAKGHGSQLPLVTSAGLDDGEGGRAGVSPPPDPARVRAVARLKQSGACNVNVSQQGISLRYQGGNIDERSGATAGESDGPAVSQVIVEHEPWKRVGHDRGDGGDRSPRPRKSGVIRPDRVSKRHGGIGELIGDGPGRIEEDQVEDGGGLVGAVTDPCHSPRRTDQVEVIRVEPFLKEDGPRREGSGWEGPHAGVGVKITAQHRRDYAIAFRI